MRLISIAKTNTCTQVYESINILCLLHVSVTYVDILREVRYKGWFYRYIAAVCESLHRCKILSLKVHGLKYIFSFKHR